MFDNQRQYSADQTAAEHQQRQRQHTVQYSCGVKARTIENSRCKRSVSGKAGEKHQLKVRATYIKIVRKRIIV